MSVSTLCLLVSNNEILSEVSMVKIVTANALTN